REECTIRLSGLGLLYGAHEGSSGRNTPTPVRDQSTVRSSRVDPVYCTELTRGVTGGIRPRLSEPSLLYGAHEWSSGGIRPRLSGLSLLYGVHEWSSGRNTPSAVRAQSTVRSLRVDSVYCTELMSGVAGGNAFGCQSPVYCTELTSGVAGGNALGCQGSVYCTELTSGVAGGNALRCQGSVYCTELTSGVAGGNALGCQGSVYCTELTSGVAGRMRHIPVRAESTVRSSRVE
ncbi:hypothetical protein J6590_006582, partial [Homalodisca vitripennis]